MQSSNLAAAKYDSKLNQAHRVDLLEYEDTFILDINKNKRIFISGVKQEIMLPKINRQYSDAHSSSPVRVATHLPDATKRVTLRALKKAKGIKNYEKKNNDFSANAIGKVNWVNLTSKLARDSTKLTLKAPIANKSVDQQKKLPKLERESTFQQKLKPVSFKLPITDPSTTRTYESPKDEEKTEANDSKLNKNLVEGFFLPAASVDSYKYLDTLILKENVIDQVDCNKNQQKLSNSRSDIAEILAEVKNNTSNKSSQAYEKLVSLKKLNREQTSNKSTPNKPEPPEESDLKNRVTGEKTNNILLSPYLSSTRLGENMYGKPKTSKVTLKAKEPLAYGVDKKLTELRTNNGRWSPIKLKPLLNKNYNNIFDKFIFDDEKQIELFDLFKKLDRDEDGHLEFKIIESIYLKNFNKQLKSFFYQIYKALSDSTFFGVKEFFIFVHIIEQFNANTQQEAFWNSSRRAQIDSYWEYYNESDFRDFTAEINDYIAISEAVNFDMANMNVSDVLNVKIDASKRKLFERNINNLPALIGQLSRPIDGNSIIEKITNYILFIPLFIYMECTGLNMKFKKRIETF